MGFDQPNTTAAPPRWAYGDPMRVLAIAAVIVLHVTFPPVLQYGAIPPADWWPAATLHAATRWCVPVFVMLSGALLLDRSRQEGAGAFYRKRTARIGLPLLFWSAFYLVWPALRAGGDFSGFDAHRALLWLLKGVPWPHMHFLFLLAGLYLVTPLLREFVRGAPPRDRWIMTAVMLGLGLTFPLYAAVLNTDHVAVTLFLPFVGYYMLGCLLRDGTLSRPGRRWCWVGLLGSMALTTVGTEALFRYLHSNTARLYLADFLSPSVALMSVCAFLLLRDGFRTVGPRAARCWAGLAATTFGVYLVHPVFMDLLAMTALDQWAAPLAVRLATTYAVTVAASLVVVWLIQRVPYLRRIAG